MVEVLPVRPDLIDGVWPVLRPMFEKPVALSQDRLAVDDIYDGAKSGAYLLWIVISDNSVIIATFTTRISTYPRRRAMCIDFLAGSKMDQWLETVSSTISEHAVKCDCDLIEGYGRKGWQRTLEKFGWRLAYPTYHKDLRGHVKRRNDNND